MQKTKAIIVIVIVVILALIIWLIVGHKAQAPVAVVTPTPTKGAIAPESPNYAPLKVTQTQVPANTLPKNFPADIPLEAGANVTQNYYATAENGQVQATRVFDSTKTADANFKLYSDYLKNNGWKIIATLNNSSIKVLSATKAGNNLQIAIAPDPAGKGSSVSINYTITQY